MPSECSTTADIRPVIACVYVLHMLPSAHMTFKINLYIVTYTLYGTDSCA